MATPRQVRMIIKKNGLPYDIFKDSDCWFLVDGDTSSWYETSLNVYDFSHRPTEYWLKVIQEMHEKNTK